MDTEVIIIPLCTHTEATGDRHRHLLSLHKEYIIIQRLGFIFLDDLIMVVILIHHTYIILKRHHETISLKQHQEIVE